MKKGWFLLFFSEPITPETMTPYIINNLFEIPVTAEIVVQGDELTKCSVINKSGTVVNEDGFYPVSCYKNILTVEKSGAEYEVDMSALSEYVMSDFCADPENELSITAFKFNDENKMVARSVAQYTESSEWYDDSTGEYIGTGKSFESEYTDYPYFACEIKQIKDEKLVVKTNVSDSEITITPSYYVGSKEFSDFSEGDRILAKFTDSDIPKQTEYLWSVIKPSEDLNLKFVNLRDFDDRVIIAKNGFEEFKIFSDNIDFQSETPTQVIIDFEDLYTVQKVAEYTECYVRNCVLK